MTETVDKYSEKSSARDLYEKFIYLASLPLKADIVDYDEIDDGILKLETWYGSTLYFIWRGNHNWTLSTNDPSKRVDD